MQTSGTQIHGCSWVYAGGGTGLLLSDHTNSSVIKNVNTGWLCQKLGKDKLGDALLLLHTSY